MRIYAIWVAVALATVSVSAQAGVYIGGGSSQVALDGDFDGDSMVEGGGSGEILPQWDPARGVKYIFGVDYGNQGMELTWTKSDLEGQWLEIPVAGEYSSYNWDMKHRFGSLLGDTAKVKVEPLFVMGMNLMEVSITDGSIGTSGEIRNAAYKGFGYRLGGGLSVQPIRSVRIDLIGTYRFINFSTVDGVVSGSVKEMEISGSGLSVSVEATYTFGRD